ncbi:hypothetical protein JW906_07535 [bacterium]|nr:hypothetical protein [bacterium]
MRSLPDQNSPVAGFQRDLRSVSGKGIDTSMHFPLQAAGDALTVIVKRLFHDQTALNGGFIPSAFFLKYFSSSALRVLYLSTVFISRSKNFG